MVIDNISIDLNEKMRINAIKITIIQGQTVHMCEVIDKQTDRKSDRKIKRKSAV